MWEEPSAKSGVERPTFATRPNTRLNSIKYCKASRSKNRDPLMHHPLLLTIQPATQFIHYLGSSNALEVGECNVLLSGCLRYALRSSHRCLSVLHSPHVRVQLGVAGFAEWYPLSSSLHCELHHDIRARQATASEELPRRFRDIVLEERAVVLEPRIYVAGLHFATNASGDRF